MASLSERVEAYLQGRPGYTDPATQLLEELLKNSNTLQEAMDRTQISCNHYYDLMIQESQSKRKLEKSTDVGRFVVVLIDLDSMPFLDAFVVDGFQGGIEAGRELRSAIQNYHKNNPFHRVDDKILLYISANLHGLSKAYTTAGIIADPARYRDFVVGLGQSHPLTSFVDAGRQKEAVDHKLRAQFELYYPNTHCQHIIFGGSDSGYASFLDSFAQPKDVNKRVTVLLTYHTPVGLRRASSQFLTTTLDVFRKDKIYKEVSASSPATTPTATSSRLYMGNVPYVATEQDIQELFAGYDIREINIVHNPQTNQAAAFVELETPEEALRAINGLGDKKILDRKISLQFARDTKDTRKEIESTVNEPRGTTTYLPGVDPSLRNFDDNYSGIRIEEIAIEPRGIPRPSINDDTLLSREANYATSNNTKVTPSSQRGIKRPASDNGSPPFRRTVQPQYNSSERDRHDGSPSPARANSLCDRAGNITEYQPENPFLIEDARPPRTAFVNQYNQRLDVPVRYDKQFLRILFGQMSRLCNNFYLRGNCPYGDRCTWDHSVHLSALQINTLRHKARTSACCNQFCEDPNCVLGHVCPRPSGRCNISGCKFMREQHDVVVDEVFELDPAANTRKKSSSVLFRTSSSSIPEKPTRVSSFEAYVTPREGISEDRRYSTDDTTVVSETNNFLNELSVIGELESETRKRNIASDYFD